MEYSDLTIHHPVRVDCRSSTEKLQSSAVTAIAQLRIRPAARSSTADGKRLTI
jgi:hypothetical protein